MNKKGFLPHSHRHRTLFIVLLLCENTKILKRTFEMHFALIFFLLRVFWHSHHEKNDEKGWKNIFRINSNIERIFFFVRSSYTLKMTSFSKIFQLSSTLHKIILILIAFKKFLIIFFFFLESFFDKGRWKIWGKWSFFVVLCARKHLKIVEGKKLLKKTLIIHLQWSFKRFHPWRVKKLIDKL